MVVDFTQRHEKQVMRAFTVTFISEMLFIQARQNTIHIDGKRLAQGPQKRRFVSHEIKIYSLPVTKLLMPYLPITAQLATVIMRSDIVE